MQVMEDELFAMRGSNSTLLVFGTMAAVPLGIWIVASLRTSTVAAPVVCGVVALTSIVLMVKSYSVQVRNGILRYRSLLGGSREIRISDIESVAVEFGRRQYSDRFRPPYRLVVKPRKSAGQDGFDINFKVFSRGDIHKLLGLMSDANLLARP